MDEALKKIEQILESERTKTRFDKLLPWVAEAPPVSEKDMGITHYTKPKAEASPAQPDKPVITDATKFESPTEIDPAAKIGVGAKVFTLDELGTSPSTLTAPEVKIGVGAKEFTLDELGGSQMASDPLMGQVLKPSTFREMTLEDLASSEGNTN